ncbi:conserved hypothetical protein [Ricinus communis]|uniref:Uncharacterized protein n=1 Tax=Ricinus communis TaxID=3988 RepID=B9RT17_RICCO|nr:conserved hypothetical protein [Ricinus communis]
MRLDYPKFLHPTHVAGAGAGAGMTLLALKKAEREVIDGEQETEKGQPNSEIKGQKESQEHQETYRWALQGASYKDCQSEVVLNYIIDHVF